MARCGTREHAAARRGRAAAVVLALAGSRDSAEKAEPAAPKSAAPPMVSASATRALPVASAERDRRASSLRLVDAGTAPRRRLRYRLDRCKSTKVELISQGRTLLELAGRAQTFEHPAGRMLLSVEPQGRATETELGLVWTVEESNAASSSQPPAAGLLGQVPRAGVGVRAEGRISDRGMVREAKLVSPLPMAAAAPGMPEFLTVLPAEEVGLGAVWEVEGPHELLGVPGRVKAVYRVVRIGSDQVTFGITLESHAPPQAVPARYLQSGSHMDFLSLSGSGSGEAIVHLDRVVSEITETARADFRARMTVGGRQEEANGKVLMTMRVHVVGR